MDSERINRGFSREMARVDDYGFDLSPDGKTLVFTGGKGGKTDLFLLDLPSQKVKALRRSREYEQRPLFSEDGRQVYYSAGRDISSPFSLYAIDIDDGDPKRITSTPATRDLLSFVTPNGTIVYYQLRALGWVLKGAPWSTTRHLYLGSNGETGEIGSTPVEEFGGSGRAMALSSKWTTGDPVIAAAPPGIRWSWTGVQSNYNVSPPNWQVVLVSADGKETHRTRLPKALNPAYRLAAKATRDGTRLYVLRWKAWNTSGEAPELWTVDLRNKKASRLASSRLFTDPLAWKAGE